MSTVLILLSTYNGEKYLKQRLDSLYNQTYKNFSIIVRDDISSDYTLEILRSYDLKIIPSENNQGAKKSFSLLLEYSLSTTEAEYIIFCDQDDVWKADKVENTLQKMKELEQEFPDKPLLVHTDLEIVDETLQTIGKSMWHHEHLNPRLNSFQRLLIQNTVTGCTVMINRKLADLALPISSDAIMHDWWLGLVASEFGSIGVCNEATIKYRQHENNSIGSQGFSFRYIVDKVLDSNSLNKNYKQAKAFLKTYRDDLDKDTIKMLEDFSTIESKSFWQKRKILFKHKLFKQGFIRNIGLLVKI